MRGEEKIKQVKIPAKLCSQYHEENRKNNSGGQSLHGTAHIL